ncbi:MAG TPA: 23S rRNA (adenine(2503)-C(2))-methyltransferase RlmN [Longimicrobiales bacterium]|nr:23S rRNA (adenine(2503)-C(2))-methyltransferase RlmN [Longimicrobiales bacterium]
MTRTTERIDLLGLPPDDARTALEAHYAGRGVASYRALQTLDRLYGKVVLSFDEITELPRIEREALAGSFDLVAPAAARVQVSGDGTAKHLWRLADGELVESVLIPTADRLTLCLSSQAGCAMACVFCATGWSGYRRNLGAGEIVAQYRGARRWAEENGRGAITNIVYMGMGEPLMNRAAVLDSLTVLNHAYDVGARRITVSTVGIVPGIVELARRPEQFRLAVSLHAPTHELRRKIVPVEKKYPLPQLLDALRAFEAAGGRRITFEYVMIDGINDDLALTDALAEIAGEFRAHVNLIPFNPVPGTGWSPSPERRLREFARRLEAAGVNATVRESRGRDIAAACGQLAAEHEMKPPKPFVELIAGRSSGSGAPRA